MREKKGCFNQGMFTSLVMLLCASSAAYAVDWLMLQGTNPPFKDHYFFGFVQAGYTHDYGEKLSGLKGAAATNNGERAAISTISPWFDDAHDWHLRRLRLGMRGRLDFIDSAFTRKIDYFVLGELAPNLLTYDPFGDRRDDVALDHLSLTFNHIPGARIRAGLFKTPGPEETLQAIHTQDYIEFTHFSASQILERFAEGNLAPAPAGGPPTAFTTTGVPVTEGYGVNGVRDWGIQVFDGIDIGKDWTMSYAAMVGNGEAINHSDRDDNKDIYLYLAAEKNLPGGKGAKKHGMKFYAWWQDGKREFQSDPLGQEFDRNRTGIGFKFLGWPLESKYRQRISAELMFADGMLFVGPLVGVAGNPLRFAAEKGNKSRALTLDYGFYLNHQWELDVRAARHELLYEQSGPWSKQDERRLDELTLGVNYHFNKSSRLTLNYTIRDVDAPHPVTTYAAAANAALTHNQDAVVDSIDDRVMVQFTLLF